MQAGSTNLKFRGIIGIRGTADNRSIMAISIGERLKEKQEISQGKVQFYPYPQGNTSYYVYGEKDCKKVKQEGWEAKKLHKNADKIYDAKQFINDCKEKPKPHVYLDNADAIINEVEKSSLDRRMA